MFLNQDDVIEIVLMRGHDICFYTKTVLMIGHDILFYAEYGKLSLKLSMLLLVWITLDIFK